MIEAVMLCSSLHYTCSSGDSGCSAFM